MCHNYKCVLECYIHIYIKIIGNNIMAFEKGHKLATGRPKGAINRSTEQAKLTIARLANRGLDNISADLEKIRQTDPIEAAKLYLKLIEYIVPKKSQIEMRAEIDQRIQQISININRTGSKDELGD